MCIHVCFMIYCKAKEEFFWHLDGFVKFDRRRYWSVSFLLIRESNMPMQDLDPSVVVARPFEYPSPMEEYTFWDPQCRAPKRKPKKGEPPKEDTDEEGDDSEAFDVVYCSTPRNMPLLQNVVSWLFVQV